MTFEEDFKRVVDEKIKELWPHQYTNDSRLRELALWAYELGMEG